ncbi:unnamed protein product [Aduncisulcus paluster]|uniref:Unnamed protein product n=1 Tax=Aduncisulcus paluster TaxID=2918883 RepID=A0ABQ5KIM9_9EUKA|nr:unnamed protein product [Aduncisulcus paluster]
MEYKLEKIDCDFAFEDKICGDLVLRFYSDFLSISKIKNEGNQLKFEIGQKKLQILDSSGKEMAIDIFPVDETRYVLVIVSLLKIPSSNGSKIVIESWEIDFLEARKDILPKDKIETVEEFLQVIPNRSTVELMCWALPGISGEERDVDVFFSFYPDDMERKKCLFCHNPLVHPHPILQTKLICWALPGISGEERDVDVFFSFYPDDMERKKCLFCHNPLVHPHPILQTSHKFRPGPKNIFRFDSEDILCSFGRCPLHKIWKYKMKRLKLEKVPEISFPLASGKIFSSSPPGIKQKPIEISYIQTSPFALMFSTYKNTLFFGSDTHTQSVICSMPNFSIKAVIQVRDQFWVLDNQNRAYFIRPIAKAQAVDHSSLFHAVDTKSHPKHPRSEPMLPLPPRSNPSSSLPSPIPSSSPLISPSMSMPSSISPSQDDDTDVASNSSCQGPLSSESSNIDSTDDDSPIDSIKASSTEPNSCDETSTSLPQTPIQREIVETEKKFTPDEELCHGTLFQGKSYQGESTSAFVSGNEFEIEWWRVPKSLFVSLNEILELLKGRKSGDIFVDCPYFRRVKRCFSEFILSWKDVLGIGDISLLSSPVPLNIEREWNKQLEALEKRRDECHEKCFSEFILSWKDVLGIGDISLLSSPVPLNIEREWNKQLEALEKRRDECHEKFNLIEEETKGLTHEALLQISQTKLDCKSQSESRRENITQIQDGIFSNAIDTFHLICYMKELFKMKSDFDKKRKIMEEKREEAKKLLCQCERNYRKFKNCMDGKRRKKFFDHSLDLLRKLLKMVLDDELSPDTLFSELTIWSHNDPTDELEESDGELSSTSNSSDVISGSSTEDEPESSISGNSKSVSMLDTSILVPCYVNVEDFNYYTHLPFLVPGLDQYIVRPVRIEKYSSDVLVVYFPQMTPIISNEKSHRYSFYSSYLVYQFISAIAGSFIRSDEMYHVISRIDRCVSLFWPGSLNPTVNVCMCLHTSNDLLFDGRKSLSWDIKEMWSCTNSILDERRNSEFFCDMFAKDFWKYSPSFLAILKDIDGLEHEKRSEKEVKQLENEIEQYEKECKLWEHDLKDIQRCIKDLKGEYEIAERKLNEKKAKITVRVEKIQQTNQKRLELKEKLEEVREDIIEKKKLIESSRALQEDHRTLKKDKVRLEKDKDKFKEELTCSKFELTKMRTKLENLRKEQEELGRAVGEKRRSVIEREDEREKLEKKKKELDVKYQAVSQQKQRMISLGPQLYAPPWWVPGKEGLVDVTSSHLLYMQNLCGRSVTVLRVYRVQQKTLWCRYDAHRKRLRQDVMRQSIPTSTDPHAGFCVSQENLDSSINEKLLFHGSPMYKTIQQFGFNDKFSRNGCYGFGVYFAELIGKSLGYNGGNGKMFIARVSLGRKPFIGGCRDKSLRIQPLADGSLSTVVVSSLSVGQQYREFIVPEGTQAYPEYFLEYR